MFPYGNVGIKKVNVGFSYLTKVAAVVVIFFWSNFFSENDSLRKVNINIFFNSNTPFPDSMIHTSF